MFFVLLFTGCSDNKYLNEISYKKYHELLDNKESFVLEIMRTDCQACIDYKPTLKKFVNDYKVEVKYINTDHLSKENLEKLFDETEIDGTPTLIFYKNGEEETVASRIIGNISYEKTVNKFKANGIINE